MIRFTDVHKSFAAQPVLRGVSFAVQRGSVQFVLGQSGAGKSVLIKLVIGLLRLDAGSIALAGQEISGLDEAGFAEVRRRCQMIFQASTLFDGQSLLENVAMPLRKRFGLARAEADRRARGALERVHVEEIAGRTPSEVGAGVRKRVAIARALALEPEVLLYDEPTTGLDPVAARRTDRLIRESTDNLGLTSLVVSHDLTSVATGDRVVFLHEGRVRFDGTPAELFTSDDVEVRRFVHGDGRRWRAPT